MSLEKRCRLPLLLFAVLLGGCSGPRIDELTKDQPLFNAAVHGDAKRLHRLLSSGADVNGRDRNGWTALHWASSWYAQWGDDKNQASCLRILIAHGANVNAKGNFGKTPLELGSWSVDCVRILLKSGADANAADVQGETPLIEAAWHGTDEGAALLLASGADPNSHGLAGWTALMSAVIHGTPQMVRALLDVGAQINARNELGETALHEVVTAQLPDFFDQLIRPSDRRYIREREQIIQMLRAAGGIE